MKKLCFILLAFISILAVKGEVSFAQQKTFEKACDFDEINYSQKMGYSSEEAFNFGERILSVLQKKSIEDLYGLIDGELEHGPRKSFAMKVGFDKIFSNDWLRDVFAENPRLSLRLS